MNCGLCGADRPLQKSLIIPEFCYKPIYDPIHRIQVISSDPAKPDRLWQKGLREKLLCALCEQKLSPWETYAKRVFDGVGVNVVRDGKMLVISNIEYAKFRLFQLTPVS